MDKLTKERDESRVKEAASVEQQKKLGRALRDLKEDCTTLQVPRIFTWILVDASCL